MAILHGNLQLLERKQAGIPHRPIDAFFRSLAEDQGNKAIGIILSGTGTDGTLGIKAIKAHTGLIIVQDQDSAKFDGMPSNAAATGLADHILPPAKMPEQLLHFLHHYSKAEEAIEHIEEGKINHALQKIFVLIRSVTGHDFSQYKKNTIRRRIERRMYVHQIDTIDGYVGYLQESEHEVFILFKELLIGVTSFFRDGETFRLLKEKYLPNLLQNKPDGYDFRIWVPGCSSGEEVYSLAMIVKECLETLGRNINVQLFGTDLDKEAIHRARAGIYPDSISLDVSPERLEKFYNKVDGHYQIKKMFVSFLELAEGEASNNILHMARPGLKTGLTHAIHKMSAERTEISVKNLQVQNNGDSQDINLIVRPLPDFQSGYRGLMLIIFDETVNEKERKVTSRPKVYLPDKNQNTKRLEDELRYTKENLQRTIEELETSKEELQSLNEEASTVNAELQGRIDELVSANDDIKNLLDATDIATIFLDIDLNIRRFTPLVANFFHLAPSDIGRSIEHFATTLKDVDVKKHATQVLSNLEKYESLVVDDRGEQYRMRVRPFRTVGNVIEGVVVTFENVTEFQKMVDALAESDASWQELVKHTPVGIFVLTGKNFSYVNPTGCEILGASSPEQLLGTSIVDRLHEESRKRWLEQLKNFKNERKTLPTGKEKFLRLDSHTIQCDVSVAPIVYKGKPSAVIYAEAHFKEASS